MSPLTVGSNGKVTLSAPALTPPALNPATAGLVAGVAVGAVPAGALIALRAWLVKGKNSRF